MAINFRQEFNDFSLLVSVRLGSYIYVFFSSPMMKDKEEEKKL